MNRDQSTTTNYIQRAEKLLKRYERETGASWREDPDKLIPWLASIRSTLARASWRQYKASIICYMESYGPKELVDKVVLMTSEGCVLKSQKTSSKKAKTIRESDLKELERALIKSRAKFSGVTLAWIKSTSLTGLRPIEWSDAKLNGDILTVKNAKQTNGRACGEHRELDISMLNDENKKLISQFIGIIQRDFESNYQNCRCLLHRITKKLWPKRQKRITLYSGRHQFSANAKKVGSKIEVAALMGHISDETAGCHYGKEQVGEQLVRASQKNIDIVSERTHNKQDKQTASDK